MGWRYHLLDDKGWLYLAVIIDLYSRQVVGWAMGHRMTANLVGDALKMALFRRGLPKRSSFTVIVAANTAQKVTAR